MTATATDEPKKRLKLTRASDVKAERMEWLADDLIPLGTLTVVAGNSGIGKTTIVLLWLAQITRGALPGEFYGTPRDVIVMSPEDSPGAVTRPRLEAAGADLTRVTFLSATRNTGTTDVETMVQFPQDLALLDQAAQQLNPAAIMLDPIASLIGGNLDKREDVRAAFDPLAGEIAARYKLAVILIAHNKKGMDTTRGKVNGSAAITDAARSILALAKDEESGNLVLSVDKSSYSTSEGTNLAYQLVSETVPLDDGVAEVARAEYIGVSDVSVSDLHARQQAGIDGDGDDRTAMERFIYEFLFESGGSAEAKDVFKAGNSQGFREADLKKARVRMTSPKIGTKRLGFGAGAKYVWSMDSTMETMEPQSQDAGFHGIHDDSMPGSVMSVPAEAEPSEANITALFPMPEVSEQVTEGRACLICSASMEGRRAHAKTCSPTCRKKLSEQAKEATA